MKKIIIVVLALVPAITVAADPGGTPGLVKAIFKGNACDTTSDVVANAIGYTIFPDEMYANSLDEKTTVAWAGYMHMTGGVQYNFKGCYDDYAMVKVGSSWIVSKGSDCQERTGSYTPTTTDWYKIEFRVANNGKDGGCQNESHYGILWNISNDSGWRKVMDYGDGTVFKTGVTGLKKLPLAHPIPLVVSSQMRETDPTVMDITYRVVSDNPTINVRALAFEDGERSFWKVVRPETFVKDADGNETARNIGDNIVANVEHKLSWKVSADWKTDLAKVKFEILTSKMAQLPLKTITIPTVAGKSQSLTVAVNSQSDADVFNALLWHYADAAKDLEIRDGYLYTKAGVLLSGRDSLGAADRMTVLRYVYDKMGWEALENMIVVQFVRDSLRKQDLSFNSSTRNLAIPKGTLPASLYVGSKAYWAIDLTTGASEYLDSAPIAGWGDEYKTTKLLMRRIEPGDVKMGGTKPVTLTKPFYIGVFEVTQKQYELIEGSNPSQYKGDMRSVESVSYDDIRGTSKGAQWPNGTEFDDISWLGKLKTKVGVAFDLPTESQWEYACRAGTTSDFNNGGSNDDDLNVLGRYNENRTSSKGGYFEHTCVGSYLPNAWGLYDMHGNVFEWCIDWFGKVNSDSEIDFGGNPSGTDRVFRGGKWGYYDYSCASSYRTSTRSSNKDNGIGFRLCCFAPTGLQ